MSMSRPLPIEQQKQQDQSEPDEQLPEEQVEQPDVYGKRVVMKDSMTGRLFGLDFPEVERPIHPREYISAPGALSRYFDARPRLIKIWGSDQASWDRPGCAHSEDWEGYRYIIEMSGIPFTRDLFNQLLFPVGYVDEIVDGRELRNGVAVCARMAVRNQKSEKEEENRQVREVIVLIHNEDPAETASNDAYLLGRNVVMCMYELRDQTLEIQGGETIEAVPVCRASFFDRTLSEFGWYCGDGECDVMLV